MIDKVEDFSKHLKSSDHAAGVDKEIFRAWCNGEITTRRAIEEWRRNNNVKVSVEHGAFIKWMNSLGWNKWVY